MIKMKNINSVIFKWSERVLQTIALIVFGLNTSFAQLPLEYGQSVMTAIQRDLWNPFQDNAPNLPVVQIFDVRNRPAYSSSVWAAPTYHHPEWEYGTVDATGVKTDKMGSLFGIATDRNGNIYVTDYTTLGMGSGTQCAATFTETCFQMGAFPKGKGGSGAIYKIDGSTGAVTVLATLPNANVFPVFDKTYTGDPCRQYTDPYGRVTYYRAGEDPMSGRKVGVGLGNICYDRDHNQLFVTNREDGKIYRLSLSGAILSTFDPFANDDGLNGMAPLGERVWGIGYYKGKVYFGRQVQEIGTATPNEIWSEALSASGDFAVPNGEVLEITVNYPVNAFGQPYTGRNGGDGNSYVANPITDIEFSSEGKMLVTTKTMITDFCERAHFSYTYEYSPSGAGWTAPKLYYTGDYYNKLNSAGGTDYGYLTYDGAKSEIDLTSRDQFTWTTSNIINQVATNRLTYGAVGIPITATGDPITGTNIIDWDSNNNNNGKGSLGDIDVFRELCVDTIFTVCNNATESLTLTAENGLSNVQWYDSTSNSLIGTGATLTIVGTESFLSDGYESIYYTASDADGCPWELCCLVRVKTQACVVCSTSGTFSTLCNNNGTPATSSDDWFTLTVTGTVTDGSGTYVVKIGAFTSPVIMSGTPVVISGNGLLGNPLLQANGSSTYIVRIEDAADSSCFSTISVGPVQSCSICPDPNCFNVTKSIQR
jgi:hypothetical protein